MFGRSLLVRLQPSLLSIVAGVGLIASMHVYSADDGWDYKLALSVGQQHTSANWDLTGANGTPNIADRYQLDDVSTPQISLDYRFISDNQWLFKGSYRWLWPTSGDFLHSQYSGNNLTQEGSRLRAGMWGGDGSAYDIAIGRQFRWQNRLAIAPIVGYRSDNQIYTLRQAKYTFCGDCILGTISGFDSNITGRWHGLEYGVDLRFALKPGWMLIFDWRTGQQRFDGSATWNKEVNLNQPLSQALHSKGGQSSKQLGFSYRLKGGGEVVFLWHDRRFTGQTGTSYQYLTNGTTEEQSLTMNAWRTRGWKIGIQKRF